MCASIRTVIVIVCMSLHLREARGHVFSLQHSEMNVGKLSVEQETCPKGIHVSVHYSTLLSILYQPH